MSVEDTAANWDPKPATPVKGNGNTVALIGAAQRGCQ